MSTDTDESNVINKTIALRPPEEDSESMVRTNDRRL